MTDRELLELAAKAAGIADLQQVGNIWYYTNGGYLMREWNPLTDDGDALRLAVKLELDVFFATRHVRCANRNTDKVSVRNKEVGHPLNTDGDPYAATRRAIVRAAAKIGRNMK